MLEIIARDAELAAVRAFVERADAWSAALALEGEAGIGKSTLWLAAVEHARHRGATVLSARPAEAERGLVYVGLADLFEDVLDEVVGELSPPRRRALETALLCEDAAGASVDDRALAVAVRDALHLLGQRGNVLVAIDDAQWLDASTASALAFALRRLEGSALRLLIARRLERSELELLLGGRVERLSLGPLSAGALHRLLHDRLGRSFARQTLLRIHERSRGNPFFALEVARALDGDIGPLDPLPVPELLDELVRTRFAGLPNSTRDALAIASALGTPSQALLERVGVERDALEPAIEAHVLECDGDTIRFTHPLLSSVVYNDLGARRTEVHRRIAVVAEDPVMRARHFALAADAPDGEIAAVLDEAAAIAAARGASASAAELAEAALRVTPPEEPTERRRRALAAARTNRGAGEWIRARAIARELLEDPDIGPLRAEALLVLADLESVDHALALLEAAARETTSRPELQAQVQCSLAVAARFSKGFDGSFEHARQSLALAEQLDDDTLRVPALTTMAFLGSAFGDPNASGYAERAHEIALAAGDPQQLQRARLALSEYLAADREPDRARALLERVYDECSERDELAAAEALRGLAWTELCAQRWELAAEYADRAYDLMTQYGLEVPWAHLPVAVVAAHRGQLELARAHSERSLQLAEEQFGQHTPVHLGTLGFVALQEGDAHTALRWFTEAEAVTTKLGWREASHRWWVPDQIEALLAAERVDDAIATLHAWERERQLNDERTRAHVTRCRGLIAAAHGEVDEAASLLEDAVLQHDRAADLFGRGRALLALGVVRRRHRQKRSAREAIESALGDFEQLGAQSWVEKARGELGRIGGRTREKGLTAAERRVATLVAEGRTNKEVAAALFLTQRTVETHLSHVYAKLGIRSRAQLARTFRAEEQSSGGLAISK